MGHSRKHRPRDTSGRDRKGALDLAAHVRSNQVHTVVEAEIPPERVIDDFKAYASRRLNRMGLEGRNRKRWARHGSTRWLWKDEDDQKAICYVVSGQSEPMEVQWVELLKLPLLAGAAQ